MERKAPQTPAQRMEEKLKAWLKEFSKTPFIYPVAIAVAAGIYYLVLVYASGICLIGLITPLILLGMLWIFGVKRVKRLAIIGLIAMVVLSFIWLGVFTEHYINVQPVIATSEDGKTLTDGIVTPFHGPPGTHYNFTMVLHPNWTGTPRTFQSITVQISGVQFPNGFFQNTSMILDTARSDANTSYYYYNTTVQSAVNVYVFWAVYANRSAEIGGIWSDLGQVAFVEGPISTDLGSVILTLLPYAFVQTFLNMYVAFILIVGMIWWTRRARRMREAQIEKWKKEEEAKEATQPKSTQLKIPSRYRSGTEKGSGETFVCSECGADVPADATVCPNCGEKFD